MTGGVDQVHHVVWCVAAESLEAVRNYWERGLGLTMVDIDLPERGLHVLLAWDAGIEIVAPIGQGGGADAVRAVIAEQGEGVYTVVYGVTSIEESGARLVAEGATLIFEETVPSDVVRARGIVADGAPSFSIHQTQYRDAVGLGICLQELVADPEG
jgi:hypothetical protein